MLFYFGNLAVAWMMLLIGIWLHLGIKLVTQIQVLYSLSFFFNFCFVFLYFKNIKIRKIAKKVQKKKECFPEQNKKRAKKKRQRQHTTPNTQQQKGTLCNKIKAWIANIPETKDEKEAKTDTIKLSPDAIELLKDSDDSMSKTEDNNDNNIINIKQGAKNELEHCLTPKKNNENEKHEIIVRFDRNKNRNMFLVNGQLTLDKNIFYWLNQICHGLYGLRTDAEFCNSRLLEGLTFAELRKINVIETDYVNPMFMQRIIECNTLYCYNQD